MNSDRQEKHHCVYGSDLAWGIVLVQLDLASREVFLAIPNLFLVFSVVFSCMSCFSCFFWVRAGSNLPRIEIGLRSNVFSCQSESFSRSYFKCSGCSYFFSLFLGRSWIETAKDRDWLITCRFLLPIRIYFSFLL